MVHENIENSCHTKRFSLCANFYTIFSCSSCAVFVALWNPEELFVGLHLLKEFFHKKLKKAWKTSRLCLKYHRDMSSISLISLQTVVRQDWNLGFSGFFACSFICNHKKDRSKFLYDGLLLKCSSQSWTFS